MATRRPLVRVAGRTKQLPAADSLDWDWLSNKPDLVINTVSEDFSGLGTGTPLIRRSLTGDQAEGNPQYTFVANTGTGMRRAASNVLAFDTASVERLRISSTAVDAKVPLRENGSQVWHAGNDSALVHTTGAESIGGQKTFTNQGLIHHNTAAGSQFYIRAGAGADDFVADLIFGTGSNNRWLFRKGASSGHFQFYSYDDVGAATLRATWARDTGALNFMVAPQVSGQDVWHGGNLAVSEANVASTVAKRSSSGDINARLFRSEFGDQSTISGAIAYRVNNGGDNYIRFCNNMAAVRTFLDAQSLGTDETVTGKKTFAPGGGGFPSINAIYHSLVIGDRPSNDNVAVLLFNPYDVQGGIGFTFHGPDDVLRVTDWGTGGGPTRWTLDRLTGNVTMTGGLGMGSAVAASATDVSRHLALFSTTYGFSITSQRLNYVVPTGAAHEFYTGTTSAFIADASDWYGNSKRAIRTNDAWLRLNPLNDFTNGIYGGTGLLRHDGNLQVGTTTTNGFFTSPTVAPKWKDIELGYRAVPLNAQNATYTFVADDAGKARGKSNTTAYTYTVNTGVFAGGDVVTVYNNAASGNITIAAGAGVTLYLAGTATTGNRTVGPRGLATIFFLSASVAFVSGPGVS